MLRQSSGLLCSTVAAVALTATSALSHGSVDRTEGGALGELVNGADAAIFGKVSEVRYEIEKTFGTDRDGRGEEPTQLPVTYVTYDIGDLVFGEVADERLTLRFIGGPNRMGQFLEVSGVPKFMEGDTDVLFLRGNGADGCPLVACEHGRFRVLDGGLYNAYGVTVQAIVDEGVIARGPIPKEFLRFAYPAPSFEDLLRTPQARRALREMGMSIEEAQKIYEAEAPREIVFTTEIISREDEEEFASDQQPGDGGAIRETDEPLQENPIAVEEFLEVIQKLAETSDVEREVIESIRVGAFGLPSFSVSEPQQEKVEMMEEDEERSMELNNFDPVMK